MSTTELYSQHDSLERRTAAGRRIANRITKHMRTGPNVRYLSPQNWNNAKGGRRAHLAIRPSRVCKGPGFCLESRKISPMGSIEGGQPGPLMPYGLGISFIKRKIMPDGLDRGGSTPSPRALWARFFAFDRKKHALWAIFWRFGLKFHALWASSGWVAPID